jgi:hypothetical protein
MVNDKPPSEQVEDKKVGVLLKDMVENKKRIR